jgi:hypothetical protein
MTLSTLSINTRIFLDLRCNCGSCEHTCLSTSDTENPRSISSDSYSTGSRFRTMPRHERHCKDTDRQSGLGSRYLFFSSRRKKSFQTFVFHGFLYPFRYIPENPEFSLLTPTVPFTTIPMSTAALSVSC